LEIEKQLAIEAKKCRAATLKQNQATVPQFFAEREKGEAREKAAEMVGANRQYVSDAKKIERDAPEILDHVKQGKLSVIGWGSEWGIEGGSAPRPFTGHGTLWGSGGAGTQ
jgi:hypothetical protein